MWGGVVCGDVRDIWGVWGCGGWRTVCDGCVCVEAACKNTATKITVSDVNKFKSDVRILSKKSELAILQIFTLPILQYFDKLMKCLQHYSQKQKYEDIFKTYNYNSSK